MCGSATTTTPEHQVPETVTIELTPAELGFTRWSVEIGADSPGAVGPTGLGLETVQNTVAKFTRAQEGLYEQHGIGPVAAAEEAEMLTLAEQPSPVGIA